MCARPSPRSAPTRHCACSRSTSAAGNGRWPTRTGCKEVLAKAAKLTDPVAAKELERTDLSNPVIGDEHRAAIVAAGDVLKKANIVPAGTDIAAVANQLIDPEFAARLGDDKGQSPDETPRRQPGVAQRGARTRRAVAAVVPVGAERLASAGCARTCCRRLPPCSARLSSWRAAASCGGISRSRLLRVLFGFAIGTVAATVLGALTGYSLLWRRLLDPMLQALRSIPSIAWVPLFILWLGIFEAAKVTLIAVGVFFPVYLNLMAGIDDGRSAPRRGRPGLPLLGMAADLRASWSRRPCRPMSPACAAASGSAGCSSSRPRSWAPAKGSASLLIDGEQTGRPALIIAASCCSRLSASSPTWRFRWRGGARSPGRIRSAMLEISALCKQFDGAPALDGIEFSVDAGEIVAVLGTSGAGKSTLLRIVGGLEAASSGAVRLDGTGGTGPQPKARLRVPGTAADAVAAACADNVAFGLAALPRAERRALAEAALRPGRAGRLRRSVAAAAFRRHGAARRDRPGAGHAPVGAAARRAVQRARRLYPACRCRSI